MEITIKGFIYHKSAEKFGDCFDRYGINEKTNKFAISDGVSKSFFPDVWAELLVEFFLSNEGRINLTDIEAYKSIQSQWIKKVGEIVNKPNQKYFVKNFFIQGRPAAATFVGLHFFKEDNIFKWEAIALGDSFLFFVPDEIKEINESFDKVTHLSSKRDFEFNNFPDFFDSRNVISKGKIKQRKNDLKNGTFYLMTDALAEWFISEKQNAIKIISTWKTQKDFEDSVIENRKLNLENDDSAILILNISGNDVSEITYRDISVTNFHELLDIEKKDLLEQIPKRESLKIKSDEIEKQEIEKQTEKQEKEINPVVENENVNNQDSNIIEIIKHEEVKKEVAQIKENNHSPIKPQKKRFWEKLVYPFWVYFYEEEFPTELTKEEIKSDSSFSDIKENNEITEVPKEEKKTRNKYRKKSKDEPKKSDDDISSITDKF